MIAVYIDPMGRLHFAPGTPDHPRYRLPPTIGITHFKGEEVVTDAPADIERTVDLYRTPVRDWPNRYGLALTLCWREAFPKP